METKIPSIHQQRQDTIYHVVYEVETEYFWYLLKFRFFGNYKYYNQYKD